MQRPEQPPEPPLFLAPDFSSLPQPPSEAKEDRIPIISKEDAREMVVALMAQATERREELGLTQYDIRDLTGIPQGRVSSMERGEHMPLTDTLVRYLAGTAGRLVVQFDPLPKESESIK